MKRGEELKSRPANLLSQEATIPVPSGTLRLILAHCRDGISPRIHWSESRPEMDQQAMRRRKVALEEIQSQVEELLPEHLR